jgi:hypothetical protein
MLKDGRTLTHFFLNDMRRDWGHWSRAEHVVIGILIVMILLTVIEEFSG